MTSRRLLDCAQPDAGQDRMRDIDVVDEPEIAKLEIASLGHGEETTRRSGFKTNKITGWNPVESVRIAYEIFDWFDINVYT